ncbi:zinc finger SWIM domain-containing protein [Planomonospora sphaerica]|uniref:Zinc finger SWIM domain-containing protein n=1 Tax=Planomonospora sphaerica TaxID=161355 RepID=A0A171C108_9ACTN|nr:zinc finger SWIM domain-containing protein [Planomonospora sphaerica]
MRHVIERWNRDQVLALAPDAPSQKAAQGVSSPGKWSGVGVTADAVWGECKGSGSKPYRACVDLTEPAYKCTCPSRKFPCKHALGLLLLWSAGGVPDAAEPADWTAEWLDQRRARAARPARAERSDPAPDPKRAGQREQRVAAGLEELERWLADQVRQGLAGARRHDQWDGLVKRLVDAQAPGVAGTVSRLGSVLTAEDWPARLLGEYSLIHLLLTAHRRAVPEGAPDALGAGLRQTVRTRIGFPVAKEEVLAGETVRDRWDVLGRRDEEQDRLTTRRVWLRGRTTGRAALVLSFAPAGQALDASLVTGTTMDAGLAFYPGSAPLRALVAERHGAVSAGAPPGSSPEEALAEVAAALAGDPWLDSWPLVLDRVAPVRDGGWLLGGPDGGLPLHPSAGVPWRLLAVSGGHPLTVAAEWTPRGLLPLAAWNEEGLVVL